MSSRKTKSSHSKHQQISQPRQLTIENTKWCTGCSACVATCDQCHAITMQPNPEGFLFPQINQARCNHCGACYGKCPSAQLEHGNVQVQHGGLAPAKSLSTATAKPRYFALSLKPDFKNLYGCATTGAAFRISYAFIKDGGVVCGCRFNYETAEAEHAIATCVDELKAFCGSKFVQSNKHDVMV